MDACIGTTLEVENIVNLAREDATYRVEKTETTAKIFRGEEVIYQALKMGSQDMWIVRFDLSSFGVKEEANGV